MRWWLSDRCDPLVRPLADRHYNRQSVGAPGFAPPGRCLVLATADRLAFWVTSWPFRQYVRHAWGGAWVCSAFRNEGAGLSSDLIREAVAATRARWPDVPELGMITFVDASKVRHKRDPGRCYRRAGFTDAACPEHGGARRSPASARAPGCAACRSETAGGLLAFQMLPDAMPVAVPAQVAQATFAFGPCLPQRP